MAAWVTSCVREGFLPSSAASGIAVGKCSTRAPAAVKGCGEGPMGFGSLGSQGQLELLPCPSWGQQQGCEHPLWHLPPLHPKTSVRVFGVAWQVEGSPHGDGRGHLLNHVSLSILPLHRFQSLKKYLCICLSSH